MSFIEVVKQNTSLGFTGFINVLDKNTRQYLGSVSVNNGHIVGARWSELRDADAILEIVIQDQNHDSLSFVTEPEIINSFSRKLDFEEFLELVTQGHQNFLQAKRLAPPPDLRLLVDSVFIIQGEDISELEFRVLKCLTDDPKVQNLYTSIQYPKHFIDMALIQLRRKRAVRVINK